MRGSLFLILFLSANFAFATEAKFETFVQRTLSDVENFGGCMAKVTDRLIDYGVDCKASWVSFSCTGDFTSKDVAKRNFESAQIAMLTGAKVYLKVDDSRRHNGYCFVQRIDVHAPE